MRSTENTILESWPASNEALLRKNPNAHFAVRQQGVNLDFHLRRFFKEHPISFHYFNNIDELTRICQRFAIDAVVIGGQSDFMQELEIVRAIKQNVFMSIIPVVLYHPDPTSDTMVAAYESGADDFIHGDWLEKLVEVRIRRVLMRSRRDLAINPSTRLPGPAFIEREIERQINMGAEFAVCYADLDNFKAYNDYYGYAFGDRLIRLTSRIIKDVVFDLCREGFVGHIAGDDFIYIVPRELVEPVAEWIIKTFDAFMPYKYEIEDRERGYIDTINRRGQLERFDILSISIAIVINEKNKFSHVGELSRMLADLKSATKRLPGSNYMIERRKKY